MLLNRGTVDNLFERWAYVFFFAFLLSFFLLLLLHRKQWNNAITTPWYLWWSASSGKESLGPAILISMHTANWSRFVSNSRFKHDRKKMHIRQQRMERIIASGIRLLVARREVISHRTFAPAIINTSFGSRILQSAGRSLLLRRLQFFLPGSNSLELCFFLFFFVFYWTIWASNAREQLLLLVVLQTSSYHHFAAGTSSSSWKLMKNVKEALLCRHLTDLLPGTRKHSRTVGLDWGTEALSPECVCEQAIVL